MAVVTIILALPVTGMTNFLVVASKTTLRAISLDIDYYADVIIPVGELKNAVAVDVDRIEG